MCLRTFEIADYSRQYIPHDFSRGVLHTSFPVWYGIIRLYLRHHHHRHHHHGPSWQAMYESPLPVRGQFLNSSCLSLLRFVWFVWLVQSTYITALDKLQSNCVQRLSNLKQRQHESVAGSCHSGRFISLTGRWSHEWCIDAFSWHQHCVRSSDRSLPLFEILEHKTISPAFFCVNKEPIFS